MSITVSERGQKKYRLKQTGTYRVEGDFNIGINSQLRVTSMLMEIASNTIVIVDKVLVNEFHPEYISVFVPSMNLHIVAISFFDLENLN